MDEARIEALGVAPIAPVLRRIDGIRSTRDFAEEAGYLSFLGAGGPFATTVVLDASNERRLIVQVSQGGTLLPTRDYYLGSDPKFAAARADYQTYLTTIFTLIGRADAASTARGVIDLESLIARAQLAPAESREAARMPEAASLQTLTIQMPGFDWVAWARPQGIENAAAIALLQPSFFSAFAGLAAGQPLERWKAWLAARYITAMAPNLGKAFVDARFEFFGRVLTGQAMPRPRWKMAVGLVNSLMGDALGRLYAARFFPRANRTKVKVLVSTLLAANRQAINEATWLSPATRAEAASKLSRIVVRIGAPDEWRDYSALTINPSDLVGNVERARRFNADYRMARVAGTASGEWLTTTPQTVNAYYNPALNEIVLPAAILQPPLFDPDVDDALNYGALGATIGHELTHAFDEAGRRYDARGTIRRWWTAAEEQEYRRRAQLVVHAFAAYRAAADSPINGDLTLAENIGDMAGLSVAFRAYHASLQGPAEPIDGLTGDQRFFLAWARMWRMKVRDDYLRDWVRTLPYAPYDVRANAAASHLSSFHDAFGVAPGDRMFRAPADRVQFW
jgi:putative endopeptidase